MNRMRSVFTHLREQEEEPQVELNLSENRVNGASEVNTVKSSNFRRAKQRLSLRNICLLLWAVILIFIIGYLAGYFFHRKPNVSLPVCEVHPKSPVVSVLPEESEPSLSWAEITKLLENKLTAEAFTNTLNDIDKMAPRPAGSSEDIKLGNVIFNQFKNLHMDPWTDTHYVPLPTPDRYKPNTVTFGSTVFWPQGFLGYSGTGKRQGKLVYAHYGRDEDFGVLWRNSVKVNGSVVMMRCGKISLAQKVANAEREGATAVLIHPDDKKFIDNTEVFGHVHFGSGDPYTPGFPSFNQTQFPPTKSSGLPTIPAQTITADMAKTILQTIGGPVPKADTGFGSSLGGIEDITVEVNNVLVFKEIQNVFGVIKGFIDPDHYVVIGAQRDTLGQGYARSSVGTSALIELAKAVYEMVEKDGFKPRRSILFASWSAGEFGVGATEWLEAYKSSLDKRVVTYISLDGIVQGSGSFYASGSPLLGTLLENTLKALRNPTGTGSVFNMVQTLIREIDIDDPAYPFLASFGIPSISFHFTSSHLEEYPYYNTLLDDKDHLNNKTNKKMSSILVIAAQIAGQMALKLVHNHVIGLDVSRYRKILSSNIFHINRHISELPSGKLHIVNTQWLLHAKGSFARAADGIRNDIMNTDLTDSEACRLLNERLMKIEPSLLCPHVSPIETPYRHLLFGRGPHTLAAITQTTDMEQLRTQLALAAWTLQSCANAMAANMWDTDNQI